MVLQYAFVPPVSSVFTSTSPAQFGHMQQYTQASSCCGYVQILCIGMRFVQPILLYFRRSHILDFLQRSKSKCWDSQMAIAPEIFQRCRRLAKVSNNVPGCIQTAAVLYLRSSNILDLERRSTVSENSFPCTRQRPAWSSCPSAPPTAVCTTLVYQ